MLFLALVIMALLQVIGIASILPFMQLVAEPETITENQYLRNFYYWLGLHTDRSRLIGTGFSVVVLLTLGNAFSAFTVWLQHKFAWQIAHNVSIRLLHNYLRCPYEYFLNNSVSELLNKTTVEAMRLTTEVLIPIIELAARSLIVLVIFALLLWVDPKLAVIVLGILGVSYLLIYRVSRKLLSRLGEERIAANEGLLKYLTEVLSGIKTVRVYGAESFFYERYKKISSRLIRIHPLVYIIAQTPRYLIEVLAFGGILGITLYLLITSGDVKSLIPILTLYALAGYRLLPALQKAFAAAASLRHSMPTVDKIFHDLQLEPVYQSLEKSHQHLPLLQNQIQVNNLGFGYDNSPILANINMNIPKGSTIALVGPTGAGKTTLVNLLVGLLQPQQGSILIDNNALDSLNSRAWNLQIGYVPQDIFLFDDTVARNIAIGQNDEEIDISKVESAARLANLHQFIVDDLPNRYQSLIGDRGVRLSGGQKQRLGLARAFYREPQLLILDEATNALDSITENAVIKALKNLAGNLTVIIIAHRLSTVRHVDCIYFLEQGRLKAVGQYQELLEKNETFREMANLS